MLVTRCLAAGLALLAASIGIAHAVVVTDKVLPGPVACTSNAECGYQVSVDGEVVGGGRFTIDESGNIGVEQGYWYTSEDGLLSATVSSVGGNVDPFLLFGGGATNATGTDKTFAFTFNMPLVPALAVPILTYSETSLTVTPSPTGFAQVYGISSSGAILEAQDIDVLPSGARVRVNKGVDLFDDNLLYTAQGDGNPGTIDGVVYQQQANGTILTGGPYDFMTLTVSFGLTANSSMGFSGRVEQEMDDIQPVPEPSGLVLVLAGAGLITLVARRSMVAG